MGAISPPSAQDCLPSTTRWKTRRWLRASKGAHLRDLGVIWWAWHHDCPMCQPPYAPHASSQGPVWSSGGNAPPSLLGSRHSALASCEELSLLAQDRQRTKPPAQGPAQLVKNCFLPLREYFKYFSTELTSSL